MLALFNRCSTSPLATKRPASATLLGPPHFAKQEGEGKRVQPSKAKPDKAFSDQIDEGFGKKRFRKQSLKTESAETDPTTDVSSRPESAPFADEVERPALAPATAKPRAARTPKHPLLTISQSPDKALALAGLDRWKQANPEAATHLAEDDILTDRMRGSAYVWYRIRVNLRNVPEPDRPQQGTPDPDEDPTRA